MDAISLLDSSEELDEMPLSIDESFEELEQSILSILAEDELDDTIISDDTLRCDSPIEGIVLFPNSSTSSDSLTLSNNKRFLQDPIPSPKKFTIKQDLENIISPGPVCKKLKAKHIPVMDNVSDVKSLKMKCDVFSQKENLSNDVAFSLCTGIIGKNNLQNGKLGNNALGDIINTISSSLKPDRNNFPKSPVKFNQKNNENNLQNSTVKLDMQHSENNTNLYLKKIVPSEKLNNDFNFGPPVTHVLSDLVNQSSEICPNGVQTSHKVLNIEPVSTNTSNPTLPQLSSDEHVQNYGTYEKAQSNSIESVQKSDIKIGDDNIHQSQKDTVENEDDLLSLANDDVEVVVEEELDDSLLCENNPTDICKSDATTHRNSLKILDLWTSSDNPDISDFKQQTTCNDENLAISSVDNLAETKEFTSVQEQSSDSQPLPDKEIVEKTIASTDEKPIKQYLLPFKSNDPEENKDIEDPDWDSMRNLTTDEERYKDVRKRWKSKVPPNPNRDLSYHSFRKQRIQSEINPPSMSNRKRGQKRAAGEPLLKSNVKRARTKTVSCTFMIDNKISDVKRQYNRESKAVEEEYARDSHLLLSGYGYHNFAMPYSYYCNDLEMQRRVRLDSLLLKKRDELDSQLDLLQKARKEINQVCVFYKGLREKSNINSDPTRLTEKQKNELLEIESVFSQFSKHYEY